MEMKTRRQFVSGSLTALAVHILPGRASAQQQPGGAVAALRASGANAKITVVSLRRGLSALQGSGGNILLLEAPEGKLLIDSGLANSEAQLWRALQQLGPAPITQLINTHWHFDHTDGNEWVNRKGALITAHINTLRRLSTVQTIEAFGATFPPARLSARPKVTFQDHKFITHGRNTLKLEHYLPAHTDGDILVHFQEANVLHAGDTWFNGIYPFIDYSSGGSIDGMIRAADKNLEMADAHTIIVPGHGAVGGRSELQVFRDMLTSTRAKVADFKAKGLTLEAVVAAKPTAQYDSMFQPALIPISQFLELVYRGV